MPTKQEEALLRQGKFDALTTAQKLEKLIKAGHGHCREAQKYREMLEDENSNELVMTRGSAPKKTKTRKRDRKAAKK